MVLQVNYVKRNFKNLRMFSPFLIIFVLLFSGYFFIESSTWGGTKQIHTLMESAATLLALFIAILALIRYHTKKNNTFLLIGTGFMGTALLDGYHAIVSSNFFDIYFPSPSSSLIPWSWNASRIFLSVLIFLSWWYWKAEQKYGERAKLTEHKVYILIGSMTFITFLIFAFIPLPRAYYPELFFGRPQEFIAGIILLFALVGYLKKGTWFYNPFEKGLVYSLITGFMCQIMYMSFSVKNFDAMSDSAHLLKIISYLFVLIGILVNMYNLFKRAEEDEQRLREILDGTSDAYFTADNKGYFTYLNPFVESLTGYKVDELLDNKFTKIVAKEWQSELTEFYRNQIVKKIKKSTIEFMMLTKSGEEKWVEQNVEMNFDGDSKNFVRSVVRDINKRKLAEIENISLQSRIERDERINSLGKLAGAVAHDLNNIIGPIYAYPDLILMDLPDDTPVKENLSAIKMAAERANDTISDLLALTRRTNYNFESIDLNELVKAYLVSPEFISQTQKYSQVVIRKKFHPEPILINASKSHLHKVLMNLVNNAYESIERIGEIEISTSKKYIEKLKVDNEMILAGEYILFVIRDNGRGIDKSIIDKVFDPFFTKKEKSQKSGSGLGLSIVQNILKDHAAYISVNSTLHEGSAFTIYFPSKEVEIVSEKREKKQLRGSGKILVVDDLTEQREMAEKLLSALGYDVETVAGAREAVEVIKTKNIDLVMLDMILESELDGLDIYKEIIKIKPSQKVIIVTGYSETDRVKEAIRLGANGYVKKPYSLDSIGKIIFETLTENED